MKQLRFTTTKPMGMLSMPGTGKLPLVTPETIGKVVIDHKVGNGAYIHGDAEELAGFDLPVYIDGNTAQFERPVEEQDILMMLPSGNYHCKAELCEKAGAKNCYLITLKK